MDRGYFYGVRCSVHSLNRLCQLIWPDSNKHFFCLDIFGDRCMEIWLVYKHVLFANLVSKSVLPCRETIRRQRGSTSNMILIIRSGQAFFFEGSHVLLSGFVTDRRYKKKY